jgi:orotidine-5'-phosphate decarboxylase
MKKLKNDSLLCVGLDSDLDLIPKKFLDSKTPQYDFNRYIIEQTHQYVTAYKPNLAFYEARGSQGWQELALTMKYLQINHPNIFTIADAKRADIGSTNKGYIRAIFDELNFDAITLHPYLGKEALKPFLDRQDKTSIILCHTSNPGAGELQDLKIDGKNLWEVVAEKVSQDWNANSNCMLVVGATYPQEMTRVREIVGNMTLLVPGIGAQGGDLQAVMRIGLNKKRAGLIINSSRGIIFSNNPKLEAEKLNDEIEKYRIEAV